MSAAAAGGCKKSNFCRAGRKAVLRGFWARVQTQLLLWKGFMPNSLHDPLRCIKRSSTAPHNTSMMLIQVMVRAFLSRKADLTFAHLRKAQAATNRHQQCLDQIHANK